MSLLLMQLIVDAASLPPVTPNWDAPGVKAFKTIISAIMAIAFFAALFGGIVSLVFMGIGRSGNHSDMTSKGIKGLVTSLIVAAILGALIPLFNWFMSNVVIA